MNSLTNCQDMSTYYRTYSLTIILLRMTVVYVLKCFICKICFTVCTGETKININSSCNLCLHEFIIVSNSKTRVLSPLITCIFSVYFSHVDFLHVTYVFFSQIPYPTDFSKNMVKTETLCYRYFCYLIGK